MGRIRIIIAISLLLTATGGAFGVTTYTLDEALRRHYLTAEITGRGSTPENYSAHHGKCILIKMKNLTSQNLNISIEPGRNLKCVYDSIQNMLVAGSELMALAPWQSKEFTIYAFCSEKSDKSPGETSKYELAALSDAYMVQLIRLIQKHQVFNGTGQAAVWVLTDDANPDDITGSDASVVKELRDFVANVKERRKEEGYIYDYSFTEFNKEPGTLEGEINWDMESGGWATLGLYDNDGKKIREFFSDVPYTRGYHEYHYKHTDAAMIPGQRYWIRLYINNRKFKELSIFME